MKVRIAPESLIHPLLAFGYVYWPRAGYSAGIERNLLEITLLIQTTDILSGSLISVI